MTCLRRTWCGRGLLVVGFAFLNLAFLSVAHNDGAPAEPCKNDAGMTIEAEFRPGIITVDAYAKDWANIRGYQFLLTQAITADLKSPYPQDSGRMQIKAVHDGREIFFLVEVPGDYVYEDGQIMGCPAVALMFGIGDDATYHNMGGCQEKSDTCSSSSCAGHEVDIMQFTISTAIPGRLYGANLLDNLNGTGHDSTGHLDDMYAWNPHCRFVDGLGPNDVKEGAGAQNEWRGAWTHTSISNEYGMVQGDSPYGKAGTKGFYIFEFARPLRTGDRSQQDKQFTIGGIHGMAAALWYPVGNVPWSPHEHYSANCDWIPLKILSAAGPSSHTFTKVVDTLSILAVVLALAALGTTFAVGWWLKTNPHATFTSINPL
ncbi:hypothetical protein R1sor_015514 [Riccia sorocarpa]|uniref:Cytochrome c-552/DMSO reductase-like haem-binding domain-containing protein n=1 Tax=Riccia sorocarpa TaxID=122646 RepID=A0ABD3HCG1_9MARC